MANYDDFSKFYDQAIGDRSKMINDIQNLIDDYKPNFNTVLELACGTGQVLNSLNGKHQKVGIDLSGKMLSIAQKKLPKAKFSKQDMTSFKFKKKFDLILCVFDSINHLLTFKDWERCFSNSYAHLNEDGLFVFDMNTLWKLESASKQPTWVRRFGDNIMLMKVNLENALFEWKIQIFERKKGMTYHLHKENIKEASFPVKDVKNKLIEIFDNVEIIDFQNIKISKKSERIYFICRKKGRV